MDRTEVFTFSGTARESEYLEDTSVRRVVLEHYDGESVAIQRYLIALGINSDTAQEIVQEAFLRLHEHLLAHADRTNLRAWLYRVAHNLARNGQTAHRVSKTDSLPDPTDGRELRAAGVSAEDALLAEERTERLREGMERLPPAQKEALVLRGQGLKYREIAEILNISIAAVGENIQRGLGALRDLL